LCFYFHSSFLLPFFATLWDGCESNASLCQFDDERGADHLAITYALDRVILPRFNCRQMSIEQPLNRLRELISGVAPIHDQLRLCDSIISDYKKEAVQMTTLAKKESVLTEQNEALAAQWEQLKVTTSAKIKDLEAINAKMNQPPLEESFIHQSGIRFVRNRTTGGRLVPMCPRPNCTGTVDEITVGSDHKVFCTLDCGWFRYIDLTLDQIRADLEPPF
jgi:hypothetical protein